MTINSKLFQTMSSTGNVKQNKLYVDKNWSLYGLPDSWGKSDMNSYFVHQCSKFKKNMHHYWINYDNPDPLWDINCKRCHTSAPDGIQALWRFHNSLCVTTLIFIEEST